jgi:hypothetical protein
MTDHKNEVNWGELAACRLKHVGKAYFVLLAVAVLGIVATIVNCQFVDNADQRFFQGYLVAFAFVLSISLGSLFFVLIQHLMRAGWAVVVRRFAEVFCLNILVVGLLFLPIAWSVWQGDGLVYSWTKHESKVAGVATPRSIPDGNEKEMESKSGARFQAVESRKTQAGSLSHDESPEIVFAQLVSSRTLASPATLSSNEHASDAHTVHKPWLNNNRFLVTWVILFAVWIGLAGFYYRNSVAQDISKDVNLTLKMEWWSGIATILFGFSLTYGAFDLLMMLDPTWFSTIFGVYYFSGCAVAGLATLLLTVLFLRQSKLVPEVFSDELQRDLGRLLFAFVFFWAYIGFSQYMLLWYANMPETTGWMENRGMSTATGYKNSWGWLAIFLLLAHFVLPFCGLMSRHIKSDSRWMVFWTIWLLVVHYLDLYWIVIPETNEGFIVSLIEVGTALAVVGVYGMSALWIASRSNLFASGDPRMRESLSRHAMY